MSTNYMPIKAADVLKRYVDEELSEFHEITLDDVNQVGNYGNRPLHVAATRGDLEEIQALILGGADVDVPGEHGNRPLHDAAEQGHAAAVELLLRFGAAMDVTNEDGDTAEDLAGVLDQSEVVSILKAWPTRSKLRH